MRKQWDDEMFLVKSTTSTTQHLLDETVTVYAGPYKCLTYLIYEQLKCLPIF